MAEPEMSPAMLLTNWPPWTRRSGGRSPRSCGRWPRPFAEVPDGRHTVHTLRLLAHLLDPTDRRRPVPQGCLRNTRHGEDLWHL